MRNYDNLTTEQIYDMLPNEISYHEDKPLDRIFHFKLTKGMNRNHVAYIADDGEYLGFTQKGTSNLRESLISMRDWLDKFQYKSHQERYHAELAPSNYVGLKA